MPYERHREFEALGLSDPLWRYMDFTKFVTMLATKKLYLGRIDTLGDAFEGAYPIAPSNGFRGFFGTEETNRYHEEKAASAKARKFYYTNCWHGNDEESDAMWKIYVRGNEGIAIRTTFKRLRDALNVATETLWIVPVKYLDGWKSLPTNPTLHACASKRKCFEHEREVRVLWRNADAERSGRPGKKGIGVSCDMATLIDTVCLAPTKSKWFKPVVEDVLRKYNVKATVGSSRLDLNPWCKTAK